MQGVEMADYVNRQVVSEQSSGQRSEEDKLHTERRLYRLVFLSFGLLCILQATLNVSLRLAFYSDEATHIDCNTTFSEDYDQSQTPCELLKASCNEMRAKHNRLQERFNALTRDKDLLKDEISQLVNMKREVEEERDKLMKSLLELGGCVSGQGCPIGWREINSRCYLLSNENRNWEGSREDCLSRGADLVIISNKEEQTTLHGLNEDGDLLFWIGLSDRERAGAFKWVDGSALTTTFWQTGQPDNGGPNNREDCVEMYVRNPALASWNDAPCGHRLRWLCERNTYATRCVS